MSKKSKSLNNFIGSIILNIYDFINENYWIIGVFIIIIPMIIQFFIYPLITVFEKTIIIKKKYTRTRGSYGDSYFIVDNSNTIYQVNNLLYKFDFNRAEDWNSLEDGETYKIKGYGFRVGFLDMYPTITSIV
tara:strand:+ start:187 stop:582 length:396 start_codon:yes stop_codon:yes gene_type:complete